VGRVITVTDKVRTDVETLAVKADTIEGLARKMNIQVNTFKAIVERYNELARMGRDSDYAKLPERITTIEKPPFYAGPAKREFLVVLGDLNTNLRLQPLDADRKVIPGLYPAGNMVGNRFAIDYPVMCAGLSHGLAYVTGRLAGQYAAADI
jgi:fumarate reductase flavoprotein subunit